MPRVRNLLVTALCLLPLSRLSAQGVQALDAQVNSIYSVLMGQIIPDLATGQAEMWAASGDVDHAAMLRAISGKAKTGVAKPNADLVREVILAISNSVALSNKTWTDSAATSTALSNDQFIAGVSDYGRGLHGLSGLKDQLTSLPQLIAGSTSGLNVFQLRHVKSLIEIGNSLKDGVPTLTTSALSGASAIKSFASSHKIAIPADLASLFF
jgi:hypothetical protein